MNLDQLTNEELKESIANCIQTKSFEEYPEPIKDLIIAEEYLESIGEFPRYTESQIRALPKETKRKFADIFGLKYNAPSYMRRLIRILRFLESIDEPSLSPQINRSNLFVVPDISALVGEKDGVVGEGSYGTVYKTTNNYALKVMKKQLDLTMIVETSILKYLDHPNIIKPVGVQFDPDQIASPLASKTLNELSHTDLRTRKIIFYQIFRGLAYCHSKYIWHLDIKPDNILIFDNGDLPIVKLADFGISEVYARKGLNSTSVITLPWRPIEVLLGDKSYDERADVWSTGVMLLNMVMGPRFFLEYNDVDIIMRTLELFGTPDMKDWPGYNKLPYWERDFEGYNRTLTLKNQDPDEAEVIFRSLDWPTKRLSANQILNLRYFDEVRGKINIELPARPINNRECGDVLCEDQITPLSVHPKRGTVLEFAWQVRIDYKLNSRSMFHAISLFDLITDPSTPDNMLITYMIGCIIISDYLYGMYHTEIGEFLPLTKYTDKSDLVQIVKEIMSLRDFDLIFPTISDFVYNYLDMTRKDRGNVLKVGFLLLSNSQYVTQYTPSQLASISFSALGIESQCTTGSLYNKEIYNYLKTANTQFYEIGKSFNTIIGEIQPAKLDLTQSKVISTFQR